MKKLEKPMLVLLSRDLSEWLEQKAQQGYKKGSLVRHILEKYKEAESGS